MSELKVNIDFDCEIQKDLKKHIVRYIIAFDKATPRDSEIPLSYHLLPFSERKHTKSGYSLHQIKNNIEFRIIWIREDGYLYRYGSMMVLGNIERDEYEFSLGQPCLCYTYEQIDKLNEQELSTTYLLTKKTKATTKISKKLKSKVEESDLTQMYISTMKSPIRWIYEILDNCKYESHFSILLSVEKQYQNYKEWCNNSNIKFDSKIGWIRMLNSFGKKFGEKLVYSKQKKIKGKNTRVLCIVSEDTCVNIFNKVYDRNLFI